VVGGTLTYYTGTMATPIQTLSWILARLDSQDWTEILDDISDLGPLREALKEQDRPG
jgi:hypothetical protein